MEERKISVPAGNLTMAFQTVASHYNEQPRIMPVSTVRRMTVIEKE
jgi:hypothetical protein